MAWRDRTWTTDGPNAQFGSSVFRSGGGGGLAPRSASIMEQGAQGADVLVFSLPGAVSPGAISLSNIVPAGTLQMNADGVTLEYGATLLLRNDATDVSFIASYTDATGLHTFAVSLAVQRLNVPAGGSFALEFDVLADETAPLLSTPISAKNGQNAFTGSVVTDEGSGTLKFVVYPDTAPAPSLAQLEAGQDGNGAACPGGMRSQAVSAVGTQNVSGSGLTAGVWYRIAYLHRDAGTNPSGVVSTSAFQTDVLTVFTTVAGQLTNFNDPSNWPTGNGKATFAVIANLQNTGGSQFLFEMGNIHVGLECTSGRLLRLTLKDSANTSLLSSLSIGTIPAFGTEFEIIVAIDLAALTVWTTLNGTTTTHSVAANSGALSSASRKLRFLARATPSNYALGTFRKLEAWSDSVTGGGRPPTDAALRTGGRITGPAATANASTWKVGGDTT